MDFEPVVTGLCLVETPRWYDNCLWYSDVLLGGIRRLDADGLTDQWLSGRKIIGGMVKNDDGRVLCSGTGGIVWLDPESGETGTLIDTISGEPVNGINDIFPDGKGGLYFGTVDHEAMINRREFFAGSELFQLAPSGELTRLHSGMMFSNGIGVSPDGRTIYMVDSGGGVYSHALEADGTLIESRMFYPQPGADGLAVDTEGGVWSAVINAGELVRVMPDGTIDRRVQVPGGHPISLCFGGDDYRDIYVTTAAHNAGEAALGHVDLAAVPRDAAIYRARGDIAGLPAGTTSFDLK